jgi:hypothetical protein
LKDKEGMMGDLTTIIIAVFYFAAGWYCIQRPTALAKTVYTFFANAQGNSYAAQSWQPTVGVVWGIRFLGGLCLFNFAMQVFLVGKDI